MGPKLLQQHYYGSLQNHFVLLDFTAVSLTDTAVRLKSCVFAHQVRLIIQQSTPIRIDGILALTQTETCEDPTAHVFNPDGTDGEFCGNGIRCIAYHLMKNTSLTQLAIQMSGHTIRCHKQAQAIIAADISHARYHYKFKRIVSGVSYVFHRVSVGNPHLICFAPISSEALNQLGPVLRLHQGEQHNVSFVWPGQQSGVYHLITYERGLGLSHSCGSAAVASACALNVHQRLAPATTLIFKMPGGQASCICFSTKIRLSAPVRSICQPSPCALMNLALHDKFHQKKDVFL